MLATHQPEVPSDEVRPPCPSPSSSFFSLLSSLVAHAPQTQTPPNSPQMLSASEAFKRSASLPPGSQPQSSLTRALTSVRRPQRYDKTRQVELTFGV